MLQNVHFSRKTQVDSLKRTFQNVTEVTPGVRLEIISDVPVPGAQPVQQPSTSNFFGMFGGGGSSPAGVVPQSQLRPLLLVIELGPDFPLKAPRIIAPNERHRFIEASTFVVLPQAHVKLANWTPHTELGKLVWEIYKTTFTAEPPVPVGMMESHPASPPESRHPASPSSSYPYGPNSSHSPSPQIGPASSGAPSNVPGTFPEIESLSVEEAQELLEDEGKFAEFLTTKMSYLKPTATLLEELKTNNQSAIATNERLQREIDEARQQTERAQKELESLRSNFNQQFNVQQQILRRLAPEVLAEKLQHASGEAEQQSDALADAFLTDGSVDLKDFTTQFLAARKQYHLRLIKREALLASRQAATQPGVILASNPHRF